MTGCFQPLHPPATAVLGTISKINDNNWCGLQYNWDNNPAASRQREDLIRIQMGELPQTGPLILSNKVVFLKRTLLVISVLTDLSRARRTGCWAARSRFSVIPGSDRAACWPCPARDEKRSGRPRVWRKLLSEAGTAAWCLLPIQSLHVGWQLSQLHVWMER